MLIFADYIGQIEAIEKAIKDEGYHVLTLTGATKDRKTLLEDAEKLEKCIIVCSAKISAGWEWKSCPTVIYASKSNRHRNYNQSLGRVQRADAIKKNLYISLITKGGMDEACHKTILAGEDFQEKIMSTIL
jgi:superfamily II DNA or RNA helicase